MARSRRSNAPILIACFNWQRLQINQRVNSYLPITVPEPWVLWQDENSYVPKPVDAWDQNTIELYGLRIAPDITANEICDIRVGQMSAQLILQRGLYIRNHFKFKLSFEYCLLEPMDLVKITDTLLGLSNTAVRIMEIEEDEAGILSITAEEFPAGIATAAEYQTDSSNGNSTDQGVVPARVNTPVIFEPLASLTNGIPYVFIAASGGVASAYLLAEDGSTGQHYTSQAYSGLLTLPASPATTTITFSVYVQAITRSSVRLNIYNGVKQTGADFDLAASPPFASADSGIIATITQVAPGSAWYQLTVATIMAASVTPVVYVYLETMSSSSFNISYSGSSGDGIYIWGQQFSWSNSDGSGSENATFLPAFSTVIGVSITTNGVATPEGLEGIADPNWGGANVWLSTDGNSYSFAGVISGPSKQGYLTANLGNAGGTPDTTGPRLCDTSRERRDALKRDGCRGAKRSDLVPDRQ